MIFYRLLIKKIVQKKPEEDALTRAKIDLAIQHALETSSHTNARITWR